MAQPILQLIPVKEEVTALRDNSQVNLTTTSSKPVVSDQMAGGDLSTAGYGPHSLHFRRISDRDV